MIRLHVKHSESMLNKQKTVGWRIRLWHDSNELKKGRQNKAALILLEGLKRMATVIKETSAKAKLMDLLEAEMAEEFDTLDFAVEIALHFQNELSALKFVKEFSDNWNSDIESKRRGNTFWVSTGEGTKRVTAFYE